jgi:hypothetical protein
LILGFGGRIIEGIGSGMLATACNSLSSIFVCSDVRVDDTVSK